MGQQHPEDLELARRQVHRTARHRDRVAGAVEDERPDRDPAADGPQRVRRRAASATRSRALELTDAHGLGDVVVGALLEGLDLLALLEAARTG